MNLTRAAKQHFRAVSWQHPAVRVALPVTDLADHIVRRRRTELRDLPRFSLRIRSRGVHGQFGGLATIRSSELFLEFARARVDLLPDSHVLDIGCGCGLTALAFAEFLRPGHYTGVDSDKASIDACVGNRRLVEAGFRFVHADVEGDVYSGGRTPASHYRFPLPDGAYTHVIMCSVVTHLLPPEVENYFGEIGRLLAPGGHLVFSTFLTDYGPGKGIYSFPHDRGDHRLLQEGLSRKGVAYALDFLDRAIERAGLRREGPPVVGSWRQDPQVPTTDPLASAQDLVVARRPPTLAARGGRGRTHDDHPLPAGTTG